jgi:hypothetical protein
MSSRDEPVRLTSVLLAGVALVGLRISTLIRLRDNGANLD